MWQTLREELRQIDEDFELVTVGMDTLGIDGCKHFIDAAKAKHPSLIDQHHLLADLFGVVNIPSSIWIDEAGNIVRPAEAAPAPPQDGQTGPNIDMLAEMPQRMVDMLSEAVKIPNQKDEYHAALRDWLKQGNKSPFVMSEQQVVERSRPRNSDNALGHAHFELATQLEMNGEHQLAIKHFRVAHELVPDSWTFKRQAWSLETVGEGPLARFWQGPNPENPDDWPYEGDWLADIKAEGAENYNEGWQD